MNDQATRLREISLQKQKKRDCLAPGKGKLVGLFSGKGGVGKSFFALQFAQSLAAAGSQVLLVDADIQSPSLHVLTNVTPKLTVNKLLLSDKKVQRSDLITLDTRLDLLPNEEQHYSSNSKTPGNAAILWNALLPLRDFYDYLILDTKTGINSWNLGLIEAAQERFLLTLSEPSSIMDSYAFLKAVRPYINISSFRLLVNQVLTPQKGNEAHQKLNLALKHFLNTGISLAGVVTFDYNAKQLIENHEPYWQALHHGKAAQAIQKIATTFTNGFNNKSKDKLTLKDEVIL